MKSIIDTGFVWKVVFILPNYGYARSGPCILTTNSIGD